MSGLVWVQTVSEGYQMTTLIGKELQLRAGHFVLMTPTPPDPLRGTIRVSRSLDQDQVQHFLPIMNLGQTACKG